MKFRSVSAAVLVAGVLALTSGAEARGPETVVLTLGTADSTCNYDPLELTVDEGETVNVELIVPSGVEVDGWSCRGTLCTTGIVAWEPRVDVLDIDVGDPLLLGAAPLYIYLYPSATCPNCDIKLPVCNSCPCGS